jgi:hypothetical protein
MGRARTFLGTLTAAWVAFATTSATATEVVSAATAQGLVSPVSGASSPVPLTLAFSGDAIVAGTVNASFGDVGASFGDVGASWGNIGPFWGNIGPFWGNIGPFWGNIGPFWGNIGPFWGNIGPFWGNIGPFWGNIGPFWGNIGPFWDGLGGYTSESASDYAQLATNLKGLVAQSEAVWGTLITEKTGKSFNEGFADAVLGKYGIKLEDPSTLANVSAEQRTRLILDWYDGLMSFTGVDIPDHWMMTANWSPALTQQQGGGGDAVIGLLDFSINGDTDLQSNIVYSDGVSDHSNGHGAAVASLMVAAHDGKGVMGIAPNAKLVTYNPFDSTETTNWDDVATGIKALARNGAHVINMSLGVPGKTLDGDWNTVFSDREVSKLAKDVIFVVAAGNEGITQATDVEWSRRNPTLLVVGSVNPHGEISTFSNRPGEACLVGKGGCSEADKLKNRFLVAPGELLLVSNDAGGVARHSGTSLAAPLVSGAIALLHDRWPWLTKHPEETADIILQSARDLGAPGVDDVYGHGLLDVQASQSPLDFGKLGWFEHSDGRVTRTSANRILKRGVDSSWEANGAYFYAFESIGSTYRDFAIPLSSKLVGQSVGGSGERFQQYVYGRMVDWIGAGSGFSDQANYATPVRNMLGWNVTMTAAARNPALRYREGDMPFQSSLRLATQSDAVGVRLGYGDGAIALGGHKGFGLFSDYDARSGGVNPLLGFASGGAYASLDLAVAPGLRMSIGTTGQRRRTEGSELSRDEQLLLSGLEAYAAGATHLSLAYEAGEGVTLTAAYTQLDEQSGLFGVQSLDPADFRQGSRSDGATLGAQFALGRGLTLSSSATVARTREGDAERQNLAVADGGLVGTAFELALAKESILGKSDRARVSVAQPLYLERGSLDHSFVRVVDRSTGQLGLVTERFDIAGGKRPFVAEAIYSAPLFYGLGEVSMFGRAETDAAARSTKGEMALGARLRLGF